MLNKIQKSLAWAHLLLSLIITFVAFSLIFGYSGSDLYFSDYIASPPETGLGLNFFRNIFHDDGKIIKNGAAILHAAYIGSEILMVLILIAVLFFPKEEMIYPIGRDNIKLNHAFYACIGIQSIWTITFSDFDTNLDSLHVLLIMTLYYAVHPVLKMIENQSS